MRSVQYAEVIAAARETAGWSQSELARRVEVAPSTINRIEAGHLSPTLDLLERIRLTLGLTWSDFDCERAS